MDNRMLNSFIEFEEKILYALSFSISVVKYDGCSVAASLTTFL